MGKGKGERDLLILRLLLLLMFQPTKLEGTEMTTTLKTQGRNQPLDLRSVNTAHISHLFLLFHV